MWNIEKIRLLISKDHQPLSKVDYWIAEVLRIFKEADKMFDEGNDKLGCLMQDFAFEEVPKEVRKEVEIKVEQIQHNVQ